VAEVLSFEEVYRRHADDVYRFCLFQLRDRAAAEDAASTTFLSAYTSYDRAAPDVDTVRYWLIHIAKHKVIDHKRRAQRWRQVMITLHRSSKSEFQEVETLADMNEHLRVVLKGMEALSKRDQLLIGLRCGAGLSFEEIGKIVGMSSKTATTATHRAMKKLRSNPEVAADE
jgi:RNA polymerase sigma factor (sigma-70 family)